VLQDWAVGLRSAGDPRAALARFDQALDIEQRQSVTGEASATVHGNRAHALRVLARHDDAALGFSRALEIARRNRNANQELFALSGLALVALARRQHVEARTLVEQGEQMLARGDVAAEGAPARWLQLARARIARQQGRLDDADAVLAGIEAMYSRRQARTGALAEVLVDHCGVALARGRPAEATRYASEAVVVARAAQGDRAHSLLTGQAMLALAQARAAQHDLLGARDVLQQAMSHLEAMAGGDHPDLRTAQALAEAVKSPT
jgi:tetratricopeptide (TPR) repeat protein